MLTPAEKIKRRLHEKRITYPVYAKAVGITLPAITQRLNSDAGWQKDTRKRYEKALKALGISSRRIWPSGNATGLKTPDKRNQRGARVGDQIELSIAAPALPDQVSVPSFRIAEPSPSEDLPWFVKADITDEVIAKSKFAETRTIVEPPPAEAPEATIRRLRKAWHDAQSQIRALTAQLPILNPEESTAIRQEIKAMTEETKEQPFEVKISSKSDGLPVERVYLLGPPESMRYIIIDPLVATFHAACKLLERGLMFLGCQ